MVGKRRRDRARTHALERRFARGCRRRRRDRHAAGRGPARFLRAPARPSIQQSDARCGAEVDELRAEVDEKAFLAKAGNGINQQLVAAKLRWIERHEPEVFARISTVFGSYDYINWRLTAERAVEQNWALEAGFIDLATHAIDDALVALAHIPRAALPRKVASHEILGVVSDRGAAESGLEPGTPVIGGAADHIASALGAGVVGAGDVLLKFGGSVDILTATDHATPELAALPGLPSQARALRPQWLHVDRRVGAQLVRAPVCFRRSRGREAGRRVDPS